MALEMGDMLDLWGFDENNEVQQLGQKLMITTLELENLKSEAAAEMKRDRECINRLINLLKFVLQERDEARDQILINNFSLGSGKLLAANSSVTDSTNSLSETGNYNSSVDSFFDGSELLDTQFGPKIIDHGSLIIDNLARGKVLPQKGRFLEALMRADPLLQTLLVSGPLPSWRNPPLFPTPCEVDAWADQMPSPNISQDFGPVHVQPSPMLNNYANNIMPSLMTPNYGMDGGVGYDTLAKRQRFI